MLYFVPDYYKQFHCIAGACQHNCCIGWEIDIDPETLEFYRNVPGAFGTRLRQNISCEGTPHFCLTDGERCPFLNRQNLCDIFQTLGEEHLCGICTDHPRFRNELPGRLEIGLGLCCEEAARLILTRTEPMRLECTGEADSSDEEDTILALRDEAILLLQDRTRPISERIAVFLSLCGAKLPPKRMPEWAEFLLSLERLDTAWTVQLERLRDFGDTANLAAFDAFLGERQTESEQFLVYLVYRHLANACDFAELAARAAFAALGSTVLRTLGALTLQETGTFSTEQHVELARLFSSEIEYSEENLELLLEELFPTDC